MLRIDGEFSFYQIEKHDSFYDKWYPIERHYFPEYEFGQYTACGDCYQEIGICGIYDFEYAKTYCNELNSSDNKLGKFRIVKCEVSQKRTPIEMTRY